MDSDDVLKLQCVARVMAFSVAISARLEAMKSENESRRSQKFADAYQNSHFIEVETEMLTYLEEQLGIR